MTEDINCRAEYNHLKERLKYATQRIILEIGSIGPESLESALVRLVQDRIELRKVIKMNHEHHVENDVYDGYGDSILCENNYKHGARDPVSASEANPIDDCAAASQSNSLATDIVRRSSQSTCSAADHIPDFGCKFPGKCCMPGDHFESECHTAEDMDNLNQENKS